MKTLKNIAAIACVAALAVPAGVAAKGPTGNHGKSNSAHSQQKPKHNSDQNKFQRCKHTPRAGFNIKGTVVSYDAGTNTMMVDVADNGVSRHAKKYVTADPLTVTGAKVYDNPAPQPGDKVVVHGKIDKPKKKCTETDAAITSSAKFTRVTKQDDTQNEQETAPAATSA